MIQRPFLQLALALCLTTLAAGCAPETDERAAPGDVASAEHEVVSAKEPAIEVSATWRMVITGTPTYGFDASAATRHRANYRARARGETSSS